MGYKSKDRNTIFLLNRLVIIIFIMIKRIALAFWEKYINSYGKSVKNGYKSNAFSPLVWFMVFLIPILTLIIIICNNPIIQYIFSSVLVIMILFCLAMYFLLFNKDPCKLP